MKKLLSLVLSVLMITSFLTLFSANAEETSAQAGTVTQQRRMSGCIVVTDNSTCKMTTICDLRDSDKIRSFRGISYDPETNTLTFDNVKGGTLFVVCGGFHDITVDVEGTCTLMVIRFESAYPNFIGTGILNLIGSTKPNSGSPLQFELSDQDRITDIMSVSETLDINIRSTNKAGFFEVVTDSKDDIDTSKLINFKDTASEELKWEAGEVLGGPCEMEDSYPGRGSDFVDPPYPLVRNRFPAEKILRKVGSDEENNYYITSNRTGYPKCVAKLLEHNGVWYEDYQMDNLYFENEQKAVFEEYGKDGIKELPATLVDQDGFATVNMMMPYYYFKLREKDGNYYIIIVGGTDLFRNANVDTVEPASLDIEKYNIHLMKLCSKDNFYWFEYQESFYRDNKEVYDDWEEIMEEKLALELGLKSKMTMVDCPYTHYYYLSNKDLSFNSGIEKIIDIGGCTVSGTQAKSYTGKAITQKLTVTYLDKALKQGKDYTVSYKNNKNAGKATMIITGTGDYTGTVKQTFEITKAENPMTATAKTLKCSADKLKTAKQKLKNAVTVNKSQGKLTFKKVKKNSSAKLTISKTGVVTVSKGKYKKNTILKLNVRVTAKGSSNYLSGTKTVTVKVRIK